MISLTPARIRVLSVPVGVSMGLLAAYGLGLLGGAQAAPRSEVLAAAESAGQAAPPAQTTAKRLASSEGVGRVTPRPWAMVPIEAEEPVESAPGPIYSTDRMYAPPVPERQPVIEAPRLLPRSGWICDILRAGRLPGNYERWNPPGGPGEAPHQLVPSLLPDRNREGAVTESRPGVVPEPTPPHEGAESEPIVPAAPDEPAQAAEPEPGILSALRAWIPPFPPGVSPYPRKAEPRSLLPSEYEAAPSTRVLTPSGTSPVPIAGY